MNMKIPKQSRPVRGKRDAISFSRGRLHASCSNNEGYLECIIDCLGNQRCVTDCYWTYCT